MTEPACENALVCPLIAINSITQLRCNSYTMGCPPERGNNFNTIILRTGGQTRYNYLIPPTSVQTLHITRFFVLKLVRVV